MKKYNEHLQGKSINNPNPKQVAAWIKNYRKWPKENLNERNCRLKVYFINNCPEEWRYNINADCIMEILNNSWRECFVHSLSKEESNIRVKYECEGNNWCIVDYYNGCMLPAYV